MAKPGHLLTAFMDRLSQQSIEFSRRDLKALRKRLDMAAMRGVKFIGPKAATVDKSKPMVLSDLRPPYPVTVLEGELFDVGGVDVLIIARDTGEYVELNFLTHTDKDIRDVFTDVGEWIVGPLICRIPYGDGSMHEPYNIDVKVLLPDHMKDRAPYSLDSYQAPLRFYVAVCQILANNHVETLDIEPDAKENRVRRIKGNAPMFTYKTLVIGDPKPQIKVHKGGTHASPRAHLRRGHYRTGKNGNRFWVSAAFVNGSTPGFVHKDYELKLGAQ